MNKVLVIPALLALLFACNSQKNATIEKDTETTKTFIVVQLKFNLSEVSGDFVLAEMVGWEFGSEVPTLRIEKNGDLSGNNGCNSYFGRINPKSENCVDKLGSTRMACSGKQGETEKIFMGWMRKVDSIAPFGNEIQFFVENKIVMVARELALTGNFEVISVGKVYSENKGMQFHIAEGRISGSTGCNSFFGSVSQKGKDVIFTELGATEKTCMDFDSSLESNFLKRMSEVSYFTQKGDKIEFYKGIDLLFTAKKVSEK